MNIFENHDEILREQISPNELIHELAKNRKTRSKEPIECNFYESADDVTDPKEISLEHKNLMIFDDLLLQKQNKCEAYYVRGRHSSCDCLYLSQNYFKLPRQTIRENANFFCLFPQDKKNIDHIFNDHVSQDMTKENVGNPTEPEALRAGVWEGLVNGSHTANAPLLICSPVTILRKPCNKQTCLTY